MKRRTINPLWALAAIFAVVPLVGAICAIMNRDVSMFYWSLPLAVGILVMMPIALFAQAMTGLCVSAVIAAVLATIEWLFKRR